MAEILRDHGDMGQTTESDRDLASRSQLVDRYLALLRDALAETGWTLDALAAHYAFDRSHAHRLLSGEKPWRLEHLVALPPDVDLCFARKRAEAHGLIVIERVDAATAERHLAIGLFNVLLPRLPDRADRLARAYPTPRPAKAAIR